MIVTIKGGCKLETEELINYFDNIILPYERKLFNRNFNMQEVLLEELMNSVKTEFLNILSNSSKAGEDLKSLVFRFRRCIIVTNSTTSGFVINCSSILIPLFNIHYIFHICYNCFCFIVV